MPSLSDASSHRLRFNLRHLELKQIQRLIDEELQSLHTVARWRPHDLANAGKELGRGERHPANGPLDPLIAGMVHAIEADQDTEEVLDGLHIRLLQEKHVIAFRQQLQPYGWTEVQILSDQRMGKGIGIPGESVPPCFEHRLPMKWNSVLKRACQHVEGQRGIVAFHHIGYQAIHRLNEVVGEVHLHAMQAEVLRPFLCAEGVESKVAPEFPSDPGREGVPFVEGWCAIPDTEHLNIGESIGITGGNRAAHGNGRQSWSVSVRVGQHTGMLEPPVDGIGGICPHLSAR
jgi:hypothetical protein